VVPQTERAEKLLSAKIQARFEVERANSDQFLAKRATSVKRLG
jgi:hypothetical protein